MELLFVYGTLLYLNNPMGLYLKSNSEYVSRGKFKGILYDIGEYPGAISDINANTYVLGQVVSISNSKKTLRILDEYEGYGMEQIQPNEFVREIIEIETETEASVIKCWTYLYNLPVKGLTPIDSGNYEDYIFNK